MKVLIDTNVLLDFYCEREDFYQDAANIFDLVSRLHRPYYSPRQLVLLALHQEIRGELFLLFSLLTLLQ